MVRALQRVSVLAAVTVAGGWCWQGRNQKAEEKSGQVSGPAFDVTIAVRNYTGNELAGAAGPLWQAYQAEKEPRAGSSIASALVEVGFTDQSAVPVLLGRLDLKANKLWFSDVTLLRHLTKQQFGPRHEYVDAKDRDAELAKWRQWGEKR